VAHCAFCKLLVISNVSKNLYNVCFTDLLATETFIAVKLARPLPYSSSVHRCSALSQTTRQPSFTDSLLRAFHHLDITLSINYHYQLIIVIVVWLAGPVDGASWIDHVHVVTWSTYQGHGG